MDQILVPADIFFKPHNKTEKRKEDVCHIMLQLLHFDRKNANKIPQGKEEE